MISNLQLKLNGLEPITREELFFLVSSWGRYFEFKTMDNLNTNYFLKNECYPLENLDVSKITNMAEIFCYSSYNGDLSKWNLSNCSNMFNMFYESEFNNNSLKNWNVSNVTNFYFMFYNANFDGDLSKWKFDKDSDCTGIFHLNSNFAKKYNSGKKIPFFKKDFLEWIEENRLNIASLSITKEELVDIDDYLISFNKDINEIK